MEFILPPLFNNDTAGFAVVHEGDRRVEVTFESSYLTQPVVNATVSFEDGDNVTDTEAEAFFNAGIQSLVVNKSQNGFTILLNKNAPRDIRFSWNAFAVKDAKVYESVVEGLTFTPPESPENPENNTEPNPQPDVNSGSGTDAETNSGDELSDPETPPEGEGETPADGVTDGIPEDTTVTPPADEEVSETPDVNIAPEPEPVVDDSAPEENAPVENGASEPDTNLTPPAN